MKLKFSPIHRLLAWYQLAELEVELRANIGVLEELQKRTTTTKIVASEQSLIMYLLAGCIRAVDIEEFFLHFPAYIARTVYYRNNADEIRDKDIYGMTVSEFPAIKASDWKKEQFLTIAKDAILALATAAACSEITNFQESLKNHIGRVEHGSAALGPFTECFEKWPGSKADLCEVAAFHVGRLMEEGAVLTPDEMFTISVRLWEWVRSSGFGGTLENMVADHLVERWQEIITNQKFNLKQPSVSVPAIEAALNGPTKGIRKIAEIVLAAENAVGQSLRADLRADMKP